MAAYEARLPRREVRLRLRGMEHNVHEWGSPGGTPLVLLHGWMDTGATWQFLIDALNDGRHVLAPDWRGFGDSARADGGYWFPDYLADLDALLDHYAPQEAVDMIGHSMGGNVAGLYAGVRPERVARLVQIEGFGLRPRPPSDAPERYRAWLDQLRESPTVSTPASIEAFAARLMERHPHLPADRADFVARAWLRTGDNGRLQLRGDPAHKRANPVLYRLDEAEACWRRITAPALWIQGDSSTALAHFGDAEELERRRSLYRDCELVCVADAGHMVHHDQPAAVAAAVAAFFSRCRSRCA
ncbi:MAG: alpha/beta hydrolase [Aquisalimonadaceae bacterium]